MQALFGSVQVLSHVWLFATPRTAACQASLSIINSQSLFKRKSIDLVMSSNQLILCHPLLLPSIFPSIGVFPNDSVLHIRWPKYWRFSYFILKSWRWTQKSYHRLILSATSDSTTLAQSSKANIVNSNLYLRKCALYLGFAVKFQ